MAPTGWRENVHELGFERGRTAHVMPQVHIFVRGDPQRIVGVDVGGDAVNHGLLLSFQFIGAEQAIPDDQDAGVVAVEVPDVFGVVHTVMARCIENELQWFGQLAHHLGMQKKLVDEADGHGRDHHERMKTNKGQPHPPKKLVKQFAPALPQGNGEIVLLARVMAYVGSPKEPDLVATAVMEVKCEILCKNEEYPYPPSIGQVKKPMRIEPQHCKKGQRLGPKVDDRTTHAHGYARPCIASPIARHALPPAQQYFYPDGNQEKGDCKADYGVYFKRIDGHLVVPFASSIPEI